MPLTTNLEWANAPDDVALCAIATGRERDSVAIASRTIALARAQFL